MTQLSNSLDKTNLLIEQLKSDWIMAKIKDLFNLQKVHYKAVNAFQENSILSLLLKLENTQYVFT